MHENWQGGFFGWLDKVIEPSRFQKTFVGIIIALTRGKTMSELRVLCCECDTEIGESGFHEFSGPLQFACKKCVEENYPSPPHPASEATLQVKERRYCAQEALKYKANRNIVEKRTARI